VEVRNLVIALACLGMGTAVVGCGGSKTPSVANLASTPETGTSTNGGNDRQPSRAAFAACMTSHGFAAFVGSAATAGSKVVSILGVVIPDADPSSPQFQAAMQSCRKYLPGGGPPSLTPAQQAEWNSAMARFAACIRKHGIPDFPTPELGKPPAVNGIDLSSPQSQSAFEACQSLEPKVGPRIGFG
jgi:hypothetical protein